ncbi:MAG: response regulator transcription factor [Bacillota bacterium]
MNKIRIVIADDHNVVRKGLKLLLENEQDICVIGEAENGQEAINICRDNNPDILLLDLQMPKMDGLETLTEVKKILPQLKVLILTMHEDDEILIQAMRNNANGYILKKAPEDQLLQAIRAISSGETFLDGINTKAFIRAVFEERRSDSEQKGQVISGKKLSQREKEVLKLVAQGFTDKEIAEDLNISIKTVESHKHRIKEKLGLKRLAELIRYAIENNILDEE